MNETDKFELGRLSVFVISSNAFQSGGSKEDYRKKLFVKARATRLDDAENFCICKVAYEVSDEPQEDIVLGIMAEYGVGFVIGGSGTDAEYEQKIKQVIINTVVPKFMDYAKYQGSLMGVRVEFSDAVDVKKIELDYFDE